MRFPASLCALLALVGLPLLAAASSPTEVATGSWTLRNGMPAQLVRSDTPPSLVVRIAAGRRHEPAALAGLAELTARSLSASTGTRRLEGEFVQALLQAVDSAWIEVDADATWLVLEGLKDPRMALELAVDMVSAPTFLASGFDANQRALVLRAEEDRSRPGREADLARDRAQGVEAATPWTFDRITRSDAFRFHQLNYSLDRTRVALSGRFAQSDEELKALLNRSFGSWLQVSRRARTDSSSSSPPDSAVLVRGVESPGLTVAWPALENLRPGAAVLALRAVAGDDWTVRGPATTSSGDACLDATGGLLASAEGEATRLERSLEARLERLAASGTTASRLRRLAEDLVEEALADDPAQVVLECAAEDASPPFLRLERLLRRLEPADLSLAAEALLATPRARVAGVSAGDAAFGWRAAHPGTETVTAGGAASEAAEDAERRGRRLWQEAQRAHGGADALEGIENFTYVNLKSLENERGEQELGRIRYDANPSRGELRQEARRGRTMGGISLVVLKDPQAQTRNILGSEALGPVGVQSMRQELLHLPPVLLNSEPRLVRALPPPDGALPGTQWLQLLRPNGTTTRLGVASETGRVAELRFDSRLPGDERRTIRTTWSRYRPQDGAWLPWRWERSTWPVPADLDFVTVDRVTAFELRPEGFDAAMLTTDPKDLYSLAREPKTGR